MRLFLAIAATVLAASTASADPAHCKALAHRSPAEIAGFTKPNVSERWDRLRKDHYSVLYKNSKGAQLYLVFFDKGLERDANNVKKAQEVREEVTWKLLPDYRKKDLFAPEQLLTNKRGVFMVEVFGRARDVTFLMLMGIKNDCYVGLRYRSSQSPEEIVPIYKQLRTEFVKHYR